MSPTNEPVGTATTISAGLIVLVNATVVMLTSLGVVQWDSAQQAAINGFVVAIVNVASVILPMLWARKQVTPLAEPKDEDGSPLVRRADGMPTYAQTRAMAKR